MKVHEYQAKEILARFEVPVLKGTVVTTVDEAVRAAEKLGGDTWVVNSAIYTDSFSAMFEWLPDAPGSPATKAQQAITPRNKALQLAGSRVGAIDRR